MEYEVGLAEHRDASLARGKPDSTDLPDDPEGPFTRDWLDIVVPPW